MRVSLLSISLPEPSYQLCSETSKRKFDDDAAGSSDKKVVKFRKAHFYSKVVYINIIKVSGFVPSGASERTAICQKK